MNGCKLGSIAMAALLAMVSMTGCVGRSEQVVGESAEWTYEKYEEARLAEEAAAANSAK